LGGSFQLIDIALFNGSDMLRGCNAVAIDPLVCFDLQNIIGSLCWAAGDVIGGAAVAFLGDSQDDPVESIIPSTLAICYLELEFFGRHD